MIAFSVNTCSAYRVNVKAVSGDERFDDSPMSNTLTINDSAVDAAGNHAGVLGGPMTSISWPYDEEEDADDGLPVRVIRLTESAIHLDWSECQSPPSLVYYRVAWSSAVHHAVRCRCLVVANNFILCL